MTNRAAAKPARRRPRRRPYDDESVEHFVLYMFPIAADPGDTIITAAAMNTPG